MLISVYRGHNNLDKELKCKEFQTNDNYQEIHNKITLSIEMEDKSKYPKLLQYNIALFGLPFVYAYNT